MELEGTAVAVVLVSNTQARNVVALDLAVLVVLEEPQTMRIALTAVVASGCTAKGLAVPVGMEQVA